jgi:hypothetical protein
VPPTPLTRTTGDGRRLRRVDQQTVSFFGLHVGHFGKNLFEAQSVSPTRSFTKVVKRLERRHLFADGGADELIALTLPPLGGVMASTLTLT